MDFVICMSIGVFMVFIYDQFLTKEFNKFKKQEWKEYRDEYIMIIASAPFVGLAFGVVSGIITQIVMQIIG